MDTIIYSALGMVIIVSATLSITFFKELSQEWKHVVNKIGNLGTMWRGNPSGHQRVV